MKKYFENKRGITLVALVITIIILIILAAITLNILLGEGGLINKSQQGARNYQDAAEKESSLLDQINSLIDEIDGGTTPSSTPSSSSFATQNYKVGELVKVGGEYFYVLEDSNPSQNTVTLIAKYCLNQEGTAQANLHKDYLSAHFASEVYWESALEEYDDWSNSDFDINTASGEQKGDAIYKAKQYAKRITGDDNNNSGRLMTYNEAIALRGHKGDDMHDYSETVLDYKYLLYGGYNNDYYLEYWLSTVDRWRRMCRWR